MIRLRQFDSAAVADQQARISQKLIASLLEFASATGWTKRGSAKGVTLISIRTARFRGRSCGATAPAPGFRPFRGEAAVAPAAGDLATAP